LTFLKWVQVGGPISIVGGLGSSGFVIFPGISSQEESFCEFLGAGFSVKPAAKVGSWQTLLLGFATKVRKM
jgi:hypothetical protein